MNGLAVLRSNDATVHLLDVRDPASPLDLGVYPLENNGSSSLENAAGDPDRGLWLPAGSFGVDVIPLGLK